MAVMIAACSTGGDEGNRVDDARIGPIDDLEMSCGGVPVDDRGDPLGGEALDAEALEALGDLPLGQAEPFLRAGVSRWVRVEAAERADLTLMGLGSGSPIEEGAVVAHFLRDGDEWELSGVGQCRPEVRADGYLVADWAFAEEPDPRDTSLDIYVHDSTCPGREGANTPRPLVPASIRDGDQLTLVMLARVEDESKFCLAVKTAPLRVSVEVGEVGNVAIWDGGHVPAQLRSDLRDTD